VEVRASCVVVSAGDPCELTVKVGPHALHHITAIGPHVIDLSSFFGTENQPVVTFVFGTEAGENEAVGLVGLCREEFATLSRRPCALPFDIAEVLAHAPGRGCPVEDGLNLGGDSTAGRIGDG